VLDKCHQQRNIAEYEGELDVSERLVVGLIQACDAVRMRGSNWITQRVHSKVNGSHSVKKA